MKKSILAMLLAVALIAPVFAVEDTSLELIPKVGYLFSPTLTSDKDNKDYSKDSAFSIGADMFFDMDNNIFVGVGLMYGTIHKTDKDSDAKFGFTNIYAALKYKFLANDNQEDPLYVYPLLNLGYGVAGYEVEMPAEVKNYTIDGGFYWGLGVGGEYKNIILEFIYGCNYATAKYTSPYINYSSDSSYKAFRINVGYKFNL